MYTHYIEITINDDCRGVYNVLLKKLHDEFSRMKFENHKNEFALSMPNYNAEKMHFGKTFRIFATSKDSFKKLSFKEINDVLDSFVTISTVRQTPINFPNIKYARYRKVASNGFSKRLNDYMKYYKVTREEALKAIKQRTYQIPYAMLRSNSTSSRYPLIIAKQFIDKFDAEELTDICKNNTYGLGACVPEW